VCVCAYVTDNMCQSCVYIRYQILDSIRYIHIFMYLLMTYDSHMTYDCSVSLASPSTESLDLTNDYFCNISKFNPEVFGISVYLMSVNKYSSFNFSV